MIYTNDATEYKHLDRGIRKGYEAFKQGDYKAAVKIFDEQSGDTQLAFDANIHKLELLKRTQARCCEAMGDKSGVDAYYNGHIACCRQFIGWLHQSIDDAMDTYAYRYGKVLNLWDDNKDEKPNTIEYVFAHADEMNGEVNNGNSFVATDPSPQDPFDKFPNEVVENVLSCLSTSELCAALKVSHHWNDLVMDLSDYLTNPTFVTDVAVPEMLEYTRMCKNAGVAEVSSMTISGLTVDQDITLLQTIADSKLNVKSLNIPISGTGARITKQPDVRCAIEDVHVIVSNVNLDAVGSFFNCFDHLEHVRLTLNVDTNFHIHVLTPIFQDLESFELTVTGDTPDKHTALEINLFLCSCVFGVVKQLVLNDVPVRADALCSVLTQMRPQSIVIRDDQMSVHDVLSSLATELITPEVLEFDGPPLRPLDPSDSDALSSLKTTELSYIDLDECLMTFLTGTKQGLRQLTLKNVVNIAPQFSFSNLFRACPKLETLVLEDNGDVLDNELCTALGEGLALASPRLLKTLRLCSPTITLSGVKSLFEAWSPLGLVLELSKEVLSCDVTEYLDGKCVEYNAV